MGNKILRLSRVLLPFTIGFVCSLVWKFPYDWIMIVLFLFVYIVGFLYGINYDKIESMDKNEIEYKAWIFRMAIRCQYIEDGGQTKLTFKGWGYVKSPKFWRFYSMILTSTSKKYRTSMLSLLTTIMTNEQKATYNELERQN